MLESTPQTRIETEVEHGPPAALIPILAVATGALVANLYYAQPLIAAIGPEIGISPELGGAIVSITQIGYGLGLFFLVSLADLVDNKKLVLVNVALTGIALLGAALSRAASPFLVACFVIGLSSTAAQVLVPFVAQLVPEAQRGRAVGNVMGALLAGIMLARPVALFVAASAGWRAIFGISAMLMLGVGIALAKLMPRHKPAGELTYGRILASMAGLLRDIPALRWRAAYQALLFSAFNLFWTAAPLMLADRFGLGQRGIGLFALAGAGGALAAPLAGRLADRGMGQIATGTVMIALGIAFYATHWAVDAGMMIVLVVLAILIDAAVQTNHVVSQRILFSGPAQTRGRINALYMTITFLGGAIGSVLGTLIYHQGSWTLTADTGALIAILALVLFGLERHSRAKPGKS